MTEPESWRDRPIRESIEARNELTAILAHTYVIQKKYGEHADHAVTRDAAFQKALGRFRIDEVHEAFTIYTYKNNDIPATADILNILEPPPPVFHKAMYITIRQRIKWNSFVSDEDKKYCTGYEQQELKKVEEWERYEKRIKSAQHKLENGEI